MLLAGQNVRKYYQRRLPSNPSKDYYYMLRETPNNESIIVEYGFVDSKGDDSNASSAARKITGSLLNVFRMAAVGVALIMLVVVAIKYMSAAPEGKAEIKKHAVIYVVGAIVLFASAGILTIIENFASNNIKAS